MKRSGLVVTAFAFGLMVPGAAEAKKDSLTLQELVAASDVVVLAKVESVTVADHKKSYEFGWTTYPRTATAQVLETWRGSSSSSLRFSANKTWACDESYAEPGETVVLFLEKAGEDGVRNIVNWGEGRFEVRSLGGADHVKLRGTNEALPSGFSVVKVARPGRDYPDAFLDLRALQKLVRGEVPFPLSDEPAPTAPPPAAVNWLAPTGWPVLGSALGLADIAVAALLWRLARRRSRSLGVRWSALLVGGALGAWLAGQQVQLLLAVPSPPNQPEVVMVHLIWFMTWPVSGLLAWVTAEIVAGRSHRPLLGAVGSCLGSAVVLGWFLLDPPVALDRLVAGFHLVDTDVVHSFIAALGSAVGYQVLRGRDHPFEPIAVAGSG